MVLIWDDRTSVKVPGLSGGLLSTHDEETHDFFNNTGMSRSDSWARSPAGGALGPGLGFPLLAVSRDLSLLAARIS